MPPVKKPIREYRTLDDICQRKDELADELQQDSARVSTLWNQAFVAHEDASRGEYIASLVSKGFMAFDIFLTVRKLMRTYGLLTGKSKKKRKRK